MRIEKDFNYKGYRCIVVLNGDYPDLPFNYKWRCGYVEISRDKAINKNDILCHGGVSFLGHHEILDMYVLGFDCMHPFDNTEICSLEFVENELKDIVDQLISIIGEK